MIDGGAAGSGVGSGSGSAFLTALEQAIIMNATSTVPGRP